MMYNNIDENINFVRKEVDVDVIGLMLFKDLFKLIFFILFICFITFYYFITYNIKTENFYVIIFKIKNRIIFLLKIKNKKKRFKIFKISQINIKYAEKYE